MKKSRSSQQWLREHEEDEFVKRARAEGYRSRASFKLLEIDEKFGLLKPSAVVVDLGAAPGGWSQVAARKVSGKGAIIGIDLLEMEPLTGVTFIQGDFTEDEPYQQLHDELAGRPVDLVISDMAPNLSGMKDIDQPRSAYLVELAIHFADEVLAKGGSLVCKCFEGEGISDIRKAYQSRFRKVANFKPKASRNRSREIYLVGLQYKGNPD
ncbi:MAG: RlmE family RNA methyltransferase [Pseudomonadales bacterium]|nr:RlmE family RNA methyltransferase [Pseudomonadales bacterium]